MLTTIESLHCNLAAVELAAPGSELAVRLGNSASQVSPIFGQQFRTAIALGECAGLIEQRKGWRYSSFERRLSTIRALPQFRRYLPAGLSLDDLAITVDSAIELRADHGAALPISDTEQTRRWRGEIEHVNATLQAADITVQGNQIWLDGRQGVMRHIATVRHHAGLRRIFHSNFDHGGRLYGGYWINLPADDRLARIRIDGEAVQEVDWNALFPRLAYLHCRESWPFDHTDPYIAADYGQRAGWKKLTNALLMATQPLQQWPGESLEQRAKLAGYFPAGTKPSAALAAIKARHEPIAAAFECGLAMRLQRIESDMLVHTLLALAGQGIVALPVHDSVIVQRSHIAAAKAAMLEASRQIAGIELPVTT